MWFKKIAVFSVLTLVGVSSAHAQLSSFQNVEDITLSANGLIRVNLSEAAINPNNCPQSAYLIEAGAPSRNIWLAQLMTAKAAEQRVRIGVNGSTCANNGNNPAISVIITE